MKRGCVLSAVLLLSAARAFCGADLENGFYPASRDEAARTVTTQARGKVRIGAKTELAISGAYIWSMGNWNQAFRLSFEIPRCAPPPQSPAERHLWYGALYYVLVVNGTAYKQSAAGSSVEGRARLWFNISGREKAQAVARYLSIEPRYRTHPGHQLTVKFAPMKREFERDEDVVVTMTMKNVGTKAVIFQQAGMNRAPRDNQYSFVARYRGEQVHDIGSSSHCFHCGGTSRLVTLKPGESFDKRVSLSKWFRFDKPGEYGIIGSYYMAFHESREDWMWTAWEDYATASFTVKVRETGEPELERVRGADSPAPPADAHEDGDG